jgi:DNA repair ATPase RecN
MAEVLVATGAIASFAQLFDNSLRIIKEAEAFYGTFRNASSETESIRAQCRQVAVRLECIQFIAQSLNSSDVSTPRLLSLVHSSIHLVWTEVIELQRDCPKLPQSKKRKRLAWAWRDNEKMQEMVKKLELVDQSLSSVLQVLQMLVCPIESLKVFSTSILSLVSQCH